MISYDFPRLTKFEAIRYFTHFYDSGMMRDEVGEEFAGLIEARTAALRSASELIADQIVRGEPVNLGHRVEVQDEDGRVVFILKFADLFENGTEPYRS